MTELTSTCDSGHRCGFRNIANYGWPKIKPVGAFMADKRNLVEVLKAELEFLNRGGYRKASWRPQFIFEDSPTCLNYGNRQDQKPCSECVLMQLVPREKREEKVPCRFIPLNEQGDTIDSLYRSGTQEELESALRNWLTPEIEKQEKAHAAVGKM
jgi:hypothetical protein